MSFLVLAQLNLDRTGRPQEGHFRYVLGEHSVFCRLSYIASDRTQSLVLRLFYDALFQFRLDQLGMPPVCLEAVLQTMGAAIGGLLLITGATGSGKTTTLYSLVQSLVARHRKVITLEDPIEAEIDGAIQTEIDERLGYSFAAGLKAILRQDPDVIVIGEIRDAATAALAFHASLSGYLVLATLHAKSLEDVCLRCSELGVNPAEAEGSLLCVVHQRLEDLEMAGSGSSRRVVFQHAPGAKLIPAFGSDPRAPTRSA
jgi:general secretion pathway protein E